MTRSTAFQTLALSVLITSGCQAALPLHAMRQPIFALGQQGLPGEVAIATRPNLHVGALTVSFRGELAQWTRRVLATVADVEKVVVTVKPTGAAEVSQTVLKAAIANGQTSATFNGLPVGEATVTITAFDAADQNIGTVTKSSVVTAAQTTSVDIALQLSPTYATGTGSSGGGATGGLSTQITILDGAALMGPITVGEEPRGLDFDPEGNLWVANTQSNTLMKLNSQGQLLGTYPVQTPVEVHARPDGRLWVTAREGYQNGPSMMSRIFDLNGNVVGAFGASYPSPAFDPQGRAWLPEIGAGMGKLLSFDAEGSAGPSIAMPAGRTVGAVAVTPSAHFWVLSDRHVQSQDPLTIHRLAPDGAVLGSYPLTESPSGIRADAHENVWIATGAGLYRMAPNGTMAGPFGKHGNFTFDASGNVWVHTFKELIKLAPDGQTVASYAVPEDSFDMDMLWYDFAEGGITVDAQGDVWFASPSTNAVYKLVLLGHH